MKTSLIIFGVIFLVIGALFVLIPRQTAQATTTTSGETTDVRTSTATVFIPAMWAYAIMFIGLVLLVLGFVLGPRPEHHVRESTVTSVHHEDPAHTTHDERVHKVVRKN